MNARVTACSGPCGRSGVSPAAKASNICAAAATPPGERAARSRPSSNVTKYSSCSRPTGSINATRTGACPRWTCAASPVPMVSAPASLPISTEPSKTLSWVRSSLTSIANSVPRMAAVAEGVSMAKLLRPRGARPQSLPRCNWTADGRPSCIARTSSVEFRPSRTWVRSAKTMLSVPAALVRSTSPALSCCRTTASRNWGEGNNLACSPLLRATIWPAISPVRGTA